MPIPALSLALFTEDQDRFIVRVLDDFSTDTMTKYCLRVLMVLRHDPLHAVQWAVGEEFEVSISKVVPCASALVQWELEPIDDPTFEAALAKIVMLKEALAEHKALPTAAEVEAAAQRPVTLQDCLEWLSSGQPGDTDVMWMAGARFRQLLNAFVELAKLQADAPRHALQADAIGKALAWFDARQFSAGTPAHDVMAELRAAVTT